MCDFIMFDYIHSINIYVFIHQQRIKFIFQKNRFNFDKNKYYNVSNNKKKKYENKITTIFLIKIPIFKHKR